jgi:hypothetical protein
MPDDLVTAAVFGDHTQAVAARIHLEAAGLPAFLADENVAGGLFHLATAVGGIKLQVPQSRLEEAIRLLDERSPPDESAVDWDNVDVGEPEKEGQVEIDEIPPQPAPAIDLSEPSAAELTLRERRADSLFRGWLVGLVFFPLMLFAYWRAIQVFVSDERLGPEYRRKAQIASLLIVVTTFFALVACCMLPGY